MPEPGWVGGVRGVEGDGALGADLAGGAVVDRRWGVQPDAGVAVHVVVVVEEHRADARASSIEPNRPGNAGQYLRVLKLASL
jgi:hypothetical protein